MKKVDYTGTLNDLYDNDLQTFIDYNIRDVKILVELDKKLDFIEIHEGIAHLGHVPYEDINMSSRWLEGAILVYLKKIGVVAPNKPPRPKNLMISSQVLMFKNHNLANMNGFMTWILHQCIQV